MEEEEVKVEEEKDMAIEIEISNKSSILEVIITKIKEKGGTINPMWSATDVASLAIIATSATAKFPTKTKEKRPIL